MGKAGNHLRGGDNVIVYDRTGKTKNIRARDLVEAVIYAAQGKYHLAARVAGNSVPIAGEPALLTMLRNHMLVEEVKREYGQQTKGDTPAMEE